MDFIKHNLRIFKTRIFPPDKTVDPLVWTWRHPSGRPNFGDELFARIVEAMLGRSIVSHSDGTNRRNLFPGGSVLHRCVEGDVLWGVGLNNPKFHFNKLFPADIDIRGVRGPITATFLKHSIVREMPPVVGDPALLVSKLFPLGNTVVESGRVGLVHHFNDTHARPCRQGVHLIDPLRSSEDVIRDITRCALIISSSLHGIIVAESYGIPARWLRSPNVPEFKFYDYYLSTARRPEPCDSVEHALVCGGQAGITDFDYENLERSFPRDCFV